MEQKVMEKLDRTINELRTKQEWHNQKLIEWRNEMFKPEIQDMVKTIVNSTKVVYRYKIKAGDKSSYDDIYFNATYEIYFNYVITKKHLETRLASLKTVTTFATQYAYIDETIEQVKNQAERLQQEEEWLNVLIDKSADILEDITQKYKEVSEKQTDQLDNILSMLDVESEPTKHIKVTIEWV